MGETELPLTLDRNDPSPLTAQLADQLRKAILSGLLRPDHTLPATRRMASELGISRGVVVRAFEQLAGEGFLESHGAGGTRVVIRPDVQHPSAKERPVPLIQDSRPIIDLTPGRPSGTPFKDRQWHTAWRKAVSEQGTTFLPPALGTDTLRTAVAGHLAVSRGLDVGPEDVIITAGTSDALHLAVAALRSRRERPRILVEDPGYPTARRVMAAAGAVMETVPIDEDGLRVSQLATLEQLPDAVLITPSHQYPLGGRMPVQERLDLLNWAAKHGVLVLEDDYDSEFRHRRMPLPAVASLPSKADVALLGTFSKTLSPWLRCGYLVVRGESGQALKAMREDLDTPVPGIMQSALTHYIQAGGLSRHITRARREYAHRRALLLERLGARPDLRIAALDGGLHAVLRFQGKDAGQLADEALRRGVRMATLAAYYVDRRPENGLVIGYGAPSDLQLTMALDIIAELLEGR
ncbi:PLP-dependent aminotransferase family protein [Paeniglutamicibacter sp. ZC-3]|uniref:MocR-like pyridoxine biosynthesis transcription factor PdxR n=1 Tax=Paeniglutamicibacter sp. ZC-3 TaxID=2986919 RepID=UPI0021F7170F|nr:PLP-dependent aminotransferase family protein [Paeniglutamicibacter sp. ZC-3]MCV9996185.1 PLP-dependent aminotransferase family protein [Paeniglutamicibacter sp. ZC-3]